MKAGGKDPRVHLAEFAAYQDEVDREDAVQQSMASLSFEQEDIGVADLHAFKVQVMECLASNPASKFIPVPLALEEEKAMGLLDTGSDGCIVSPAQLSVWGMTYDAKPRLIKGFNASASTLGQVQLRVRVPGRDFHHVFYVADGPEDVPVLLCLGILPRPESQSRVYPRHSGISPKETLEWNTRSLLLVIWSGTIEVA